VAAIAVEMHCPRLQWQVLDWNTPAIDFLPRHGRRFMDEWRTARITGEALDKLAGIAEPGDDNAVESDTPICPSRRHPPHRRWRSEEFA